MPYCSHTISPCVYVSRDYYAKTANSVSCLLVSLQKAACLFAICWFCDRVYISVLNQDWVFIDPPRVVVVRDSKLGTATVGL